MELYCVPHIDLEYVDLVLLSDLHIGCQNLALDLLKHDIEAIKNNPNARFLIPGDCFQKDLKGHKVGNVYHQAIPPGEQKYVLRDLLKPIVDKGIGAVGGNHDERSQEDNDDVRDLCELLGLHYFKDEICVQFSIGQKANGKPAVYSGYGVHGVAGGSVGNIANALVKLTNVCDADFYFAGHAHQMVTFPLGWFRRDLYNKNMIPVTRQFVAAGSYQGRERYPVTHAMTPKVLGSPVVRLSGKRKEISVSLANEFTV